MPASRLLAAVGLFGAVVTAAPAAQARAADTTAPTVAITTPASGSTVTGVVAVAGTAADNARLASVWVAVDAGAWTQASLRKGGGWSTSVDTAPLATGAHTIVARAADAAGNTSSASVSVSVASALPPPDPAPPTVAIATPVAGATVSGTVAMAGTAAAGSGTTLARVEVAVDAGPWALAAGTTSWSASLPLSGVPNGSHTLSARATDAAGIARTASVGVLVANPLPAPTIAITAPVGGATVSGTATMAGTAAAATGTTLARVEVALDAGPWALAAGTGSWSASLSLAGVTAGTHTLSARATDATGAATTASVGVSVAATTTTSSSWVSPEGVHIDIDSAGGWTTAQIYSMLTANALDLDRIGPSLTVKVQDLYNSQATAAASTSGGRYTSITAIIYLQGVSSTFAATPDTVLAHEYGHVWSWYHLYLDHQGDWSSYLGTRWSTADGSVTLAGDTRLESTYVWQRVEIIADDYRLLFGSPAAVAGRDAHLNPYIPDPRSQPGLRDFLAGPWRSA